MSDGVDPFRRIVSASQAQSSVIIHARRPGTHSHFPTRRAATSRPDAFESPLPHRHRAPPPRVPNSASKRAPCRHTTVSTTTPPCHLATTRLAAISCHLVPTPLRCAVLSLGSVPDPSADCLRNAFRRATRPSWRPSHHRSTAPASSSSRLRKRPSARSWRLRVPPTVVARSSGSTCAPSMSRVS